MTRPSGLAFSGGTRDPTDFLDHELELLARSLPATLLAGGDERLALCRETGRNQYGCSPQPVAALALGSCTASSISPRAYAAAGRVYDELKAQAGDLTGLWDLVHQRFLELRERLSAVMRFDRVEGTRVVLTPSGTDAEYLAAVLARGPTARLLNIVVAPREVGSGTVLAAGGQHFGTQTPRGESRRSGEFLKGGSPNEIEVVSVGLRGRDGLVVPGTELDAEVERLVDRGLAEGARVLVHVVAHSKTGAHAPTLACVQRLRAKAPEQVHVLVDAAQGRVSRRGLGDVLDAGYMVLFTGSKFYGGPPFSGALLVPPELDPPPSGLPLSEGMADYFTASELPTEWEQLRAQLPTPPNLGLLLRWTAALVELEAYYQLDADVRLKILRAFESIVPRTLGASPYITLDQLAPPVDGDRVGRVLESKRTVYPFWLYPPDGGRAHFDQAQLRRVFHWVNQDLSGRLPGLCETDAAIVAESFHIGQPVLLSESGGLAVLRIALGAALMLRVGEETALGGTLDARIAWLEAGLVRLRRKLELIVDHAEALTAQDVSQEGVGRDDA